MKKTAAIFLIFLAILGISCSNISKAADNIVIVNTIEDWNIASTSEHLFVFFYSDKCDWCHKQEPIVDKLAENFPNITFVKVNAVQFKSIARQNRVLSYPTMIFHNLRFVGFRELNSVTAELNAYFENQNRYP